MLSLRFGAIYTALRVLQLVKTDRELVAKQSSRLDKNKKLTRRG